MQFLFSFLINIVLMLINTLKIYNIFAGENDVIFQKLTMFFALFFGGFFNLKNFGTLIEFVGNSSTIFSIENIIQFNFACIYESFHT